MSYRFDFYFRSGLSRYLSRHRQVYVVQHAAMVRYRRSIDFLSPYRLHTRLVWYDDRSLYFEQRFVTLSDGFVRAVALCKNTAVNCDVPRMVRESFGFERPSECPALVRSFVEFERESSERLRAEAVAAETLREKKVA